MSKEIESDIKDFIADRLKKCNKTEFVENEIVECVYPIAFVKVIKGEAVNDLCFCGKDIIRRKKRNNYLKTKFFSNED